MDESTKQAARRIIANELKKDLHINSDIDLSEFSGDEMLGIRSAQLHLQNITNPYLILFMRELETELALRLYLQIQPAMESSSKNGSAKKGGSKMAQQNDGKYVAKLSDSQKEVVSKLEAFAGDGLSDRAKTLFSQSVRWVGEKQTLRALDNAQKAVEDDKSLKSHEVLEKYVYSSVYPKLTNEERTFVNKVNQLIGDESQKQLSRMSRNVKILGMDEVSAICERSVEKQKKGEIQKEKLGAYLSASIFKAVGEHFKDMEQDRKQEAAIDFFAEKEKEVGKQQAPAQEPEAPGLGD